MFTDETELLGNAEKSDDDGDEPRVERVRARRRHRLEDHHLQKDQAWSTSDEGGAAAPSRFNKNKTVIISVTRLGDLLDFGPLFKAFGNN